MNHQEKANEPHTRAQALREDDPGAMDRLHESVEDGVQRTGDAIMETCGDAIREKRDLNDREQDRLWTALARDPAPAITYADALGILSPETEWFDPDAITEGILEHAWLHLGRPGECGGNCPAFSPLSLEPE